MTLWEKAGCIEEGEKFPSKLSESEIRNLNQLNLL